MPDDKMQEKQYNDEEDFGALLDQHLPKAAPKSQGDIIDANVVAVLDDVVLVTYGSKEEIPIGKEEFLAPNGEMSVNVGDSIRVLLTGWTEDGEPELSYRQARSAVALRMLEEAFEHQVPVRGKVARVVNAGLIVDVGIPAFMPASQIDLFRVADLNALIGQEVEALVLEYDPRQKRALLSRRKLLSDRQDRTRQTFFDKISPGMVLKGTVRDVLDFGVFVDLDGIDGFIPRSELTYDRGRHPSELVSVGDKVEVKVLEATRDTGKITLSRKRLNEDPWTTIRESYPIGATVTGTVVSIQEFGVFVQLQEGITGLIHASEISWERGKKTPKDHFMQGDTVTCQVLEIDEEQKRLALSLKQLARDPWLDIEAKYPIGSRHTGTVTSLRDFGAIVSLDEFTDGLLHIGDICWEKRLAHPSEMLKEDQKVKVVVLKLDGAKRRIGLGMKQLTGSPFEQYVQKHRAGSIVTGRTTRFERFGAFVELSPNVEGLIHISELDDQRVDSPDKVLRLDSEVTVKILEYNMEKQRIALSRKEAVRQQEQENMKQYMKGAEPKAGTTSLGAALKAALKNSGKG